MGDPKKPGRDPVAALLEFAADYEQSADEAEKELRDAGVDVDGFVSRLAVRLQDDAKAERLAWLTNARASLAKTSSTKHADRYQAMDRNALVAELRSRRSVPSQAQAYFHKLDAIGEDDLRTLLADLDELDEEEDPT